MVEEKNMVCVVCPIGCSLKVFMDNGRVMSVEGNTCNRGYDYAVSEMTNPSRVLTSTVKLKNSKIQMLPVKTDKPVPKGLLFECMKLINAAEVSAPVKPGDVIIENILGTGANIIATRNITTSG